MKKTMMLSLMAALTFSACSGKQEKEKPLSQSNFDLSVAPGVDFYQYACGGWIANNPLKPEYSRYGSFDRLADLCEEQMHTLVTELSEKKQIDGSIAAKVSDLYNLGLDSVRLNAEGFAPVVADLEEINGITDMKNMSSVIGRLHAEGVYPFFFVYVGPDSKNSSVNLLSLNQGGIAMGDRDYYLSADSTNIALRESYIKYIERLFTLAGYSPESARKAAQSVMKIETELARLSYTRVELRDPQKNYNRMSYTDFLRREKDFDWNGFFTSLGVDSLQYIDAGQLAFIDGVDKLYNRLSLQEVKDYMAFTVLNSAASYLSDEFYEAKFDFYGRTLSGQQEPRLRWKRSLATTDAVLSEALGEIYVKKYFRRSRKIVC